MLHMSAQTAERKPQTSLADELAFAHKNLGDAFGVPFSALYNFLNASFSSLPFSWLPLVLFSLPLSWKNLQRCFVATK